MTEHTARRAMYTRPQHSQLTRAVTWAAVTGAALLATTFALSSPAIADDTVPPDTTTEPSDATSTTETPTPTEPTPTEPSEPSTTPTEPTPTPTETAGSEKSAEQMAEPEDVAAAVEPDFGFNKFRVGVQLEDGSVVPNGPTTLGSEITITETRPNEPDRVTTCTTTLEDPIEPTTTFCEDLGPDFVPDDDFYFSNGPGSTITVQQTGVNDGLVIVDGTKIVVPCGDCSESEGDVLLTDALISDPDGDDDGDDDGDESDDEESDDAKDGKLPNVGGPDAMLLGYGAILLAIGSRLIAVARTRPRHRADGLSI